MNKKSNFKGIAHKTESKDCAYCGRLFFNRKSIASRGDWLNVKYCSSLCRNKAKKEKIKKA
jgi:hypothetical protein